MFTRAAASDYDDWETEHQNPGWGSAKLIPLLKKVLYPPFLRVSFLHSLQAETYQAPGDSRIHGTSGPIKVSYTSDQHNVGTQFLDAAARYDKEREHTADTTDFYSCNAYGVRLSRYLPSDDLLNLSASRDGPCGYFPYLNSFVVLTFNA